MTKVSLELSADIKKRLDQYLLDQFGSIHGRQQGIITAAINEYLDLHERTSKPMKQVMEPPINVNGPATTEEKEIEYCVVPESEPPASASKPALKDELDADDEDRVIELYENGVRSEDIAKIIGCEVSLIEGYIREWNKSCDSVETGPTTPTAKPKGKKQPSRRRPTAKVIFTYAEDAIIREELAKGTKMKLIARLLKRETQYQTVRTHIHEIEDVMKKASSGAT